MYFGLGLRAEHYEAVLNEKPTVDWFEVMSEDYMTAAGQSFIYLEKIRQHYPISLHGVSLSIGSTDPLNRQYLKELKVLAQKMQPLWISDHLCWTGVRGINTHDLLPLPYTEEALTHVVQRVREVQDYLDQVLVLENVSSYLSFAHSEMSEVEFLIEVAKRSGCMILLDINNIYVSAFNHGFNPQAYLNLIPVEKVKQFHLAGHKNQQDYLIDTHDEKIIEAVWQLYTLALHLFGPVPTSIERDSNIPPLAELLVELNHARTIAHKQLNSRAVIT